VDGSRKGAQQGNEAGMDIRACLYLQGYVSEGIVEYSCSGMLQDVAGSRGM